MNTKELIKHHERCIAVLEMIERCEMRINASKMNRHIAANMRFVSYFLKENKSIEKYTKICEYLKKRYNNLKNKYNEQIN